LAGLVVAAAVTSGNENQGPLDFLPMDEATDRENRDDGSSTGAMIFGGDGTNHAG
jgi:hypothetical protein